MLIESENYNRGKLVIIGYNLTPLLQLHDHDINVTN